MRAEAAAALAQAPQSAARGHWVIVCFGLDATCINRQPWATAHGIALGLERSGLDVTIITDAQAPPRDQPYEVASVPRLMARGRPTAELDRLISSLTPTRILLFTGPLALARQTPLEWTAPTLLLMASPRLRAAELWALGPRALWEDRREMALPLANALLPEALLRRGYRRSAAAGIVYLSAAARERYRALGLPQGRYLRPQSLVSLPPRPERRRGELPTICFLGPPLAARGVDLAVESFERAVGSGLRARLLMLLRPDVGPSTMQRITARIEASPCRPLIVTTTAMLEAEELERLIAGCAAFLLPFRTPVSEVPLVVLEAGLSGRPSVVLDAPGVGEYARALGGIVASGPDDLPAAICRAVRNPPEIAVDPEHWRRWDRAVAPLLEPLERPLERWRLIALTGVDGSGKSFLTRHLGQHLHAEGIAHRHVWSRFRNYLTKPLLALTRLTGHNRKEETEGVRIGYHDFAGNRPLALLFLALQTFDNILDILLRYRLGGRGRAIVSDRCVFDTLVDLAIDTGLDDLVIERIGPLLISLLPRPRRVILLRRSVAHIRADRADALVDRHFARRRVLYERLAQRFDLPVLDNDGPAEIVLWQLRRLLGDELDRVR